MRFISSFLYLAVILLSVTACAWRTAEVIPPLEIPSAISPSGNANLEDRWWLALDDPTLNGLVEKALSNNFTLRSTWDRLAEAESIARKDRADRFPAVEAEADAFRSRSIRGENITRTGQQTGSFTRFSLGAVASYELDLWGRVRSTHDASRLDLRATEAQLQAAAITLSAEVAITWYRLVEQYGELELLERQMETNLKVMELVMLRFRRGQVGATDVLQQRQLAESVRGEIASARSRAEVLEHQVSILTGNPPTVRMAAPVTRLAALPPLPEAGLPGDLVRRRPDIREAFHKVQAADRRVAAAIADRFPRISLSAQASGSSEHARDLFDNWLGTLAANLLGPIIDGGSRRAEVDRTRAVKSQRLNEYGQAILDGFGEVEDALTQEKRQKELIESLEKQFEFSEQVIERLRDNYSHGALDYLRVLDALLTHQALERNLLQARRQIIEYRITLYRALAGGWDMTPPQSAVDGETGRGDVATETAAKQNE